MAPYWLLVAYATGIGLSAFTEPLAGPWPSLFAGMLGLSWLALHRTVWASLPLAGAIALAGLLWAHLSTEPPRRANDISRYVSPELVAVEGVVRQTERLWDGSTRLDIDVARAGTGSAAVSASGVVRLSIREGGTDAAPGDRVCWQGRLRRPLRFGTPGEFDYPRYLAARGIYVTASIARGAELARMAPDRTTPRPFWERCRNAIARRIAGVLPADRAGLVQALTVGIGSGISPDQRRVLSDGGLAHLFSISGLHFGLLALFLYGMSNWLYCRSERLLLLTPPRRILPLLLLLPLAGYLLLSGNGAPTRRAFAMTALGALLFSCHRRTAPPALLATVAFGMLILSPLSMFEPSFQLSFAGVLGLIIWLPRWQRHLDGRPGWQRSIGLMLLTTTAASLATAPFALWHFHQVAPAGLVTNLIAIPLVAWGAVPAGLLGTVLLPLAPPVADLCFSLAGNLSGFALKTTAWFLGLPGLAATPLFVSWREGLGAGLLLVTAMLPGRCRLAIGIGIAAGLFLLFLPHPDSARLQVTALSVGQGDATLLSIAPGRHYLVDGGGLTGSTVDIGERLVAPALGRLGVDRLNGVILTHDHPDHSAGLPYILEHFQVDGFWTAIPPESLEPRLAEALARRHVPVHTLPEGWSVFETGGKPLRLFVPPQEAEDPNDRSIVIHTAVDDEGVLLPGDLAAKGFEALCTAGLPEPVTLLKLAHHGSRGSRPEGFLDRLQPRAAFVSAGRDNPYRLPHPSSVAACRDRDIPLYRTDHQGTLTFSSNGNPWQVQCFTGVGH